MGKIPPDKKLGEGVRRHDRVEIPEAVLQRVRSLYEAGRYVDAYQVTREAGPLQAWRGSQAQTLAYRLANNLGAPRLASLLILRALRETPHDPETAVHFGYYTMGRRGPAAAWRHALQAETLPGIDTDSLADLKANRACIAGIYRDFEVAWTLWNEATVIHQVSPWLLVEKSSILLNQEKREEALEALDESLALRPWYRPAVQYRGRLLHLLGRRDEAVAFLTTSLEHLQCYSIAAQLMILKREVDDYEGMEGLIGLVQSLAVLCEPVEQEWLAARRVDILISRGDYPAAAALAGKISGDYYPALAARIVQPGIGCRRLRLPFEFVHQKHNTCAPATLAAICHYWRRPVTMDQIVDAICYDGTYDYSERSWALANGFAVCEFTVTEESIHRLIEAGVPFVLTTSEINSAHSQAVIGFDELRATLFIQDPGEPHYREEGMVEFLSRYKLMGPRGMVMVPSENQPWLDELELPDKAIYDLNYRFSQALGVYDRARARQALDEMAGLAPEHRLTLIGSLALESFDGNEVARLGWINRLLEDFPDEPRLLNWKVQALQTLGTRHERMALLTRARDSKNPHPAFTRDLASEMMEDAQDLEKASRLMWKAHAQMPMDASILVHLADLMRRSQGEAAAQALTWYRFAASYGDKVEQFSRTWFSYAIVKNRSEEALDWLRRRMQSYGEKSGAPAVTLVQALDVLCMPESLEVARQAVALRPTDGELLILLAGMESRVGNHEKAGALLKQAEGHCLPKAWLRAQAAMLRRSGDYEGELSIWRQIILQEPLALDAHGAVARELMTSQGPVAAIRYYEGQCADFPHHYGLAQAHVLWLRDHDAGKAAREAERICQLHPADPWARRELALILLDCGRKEEALEWAKSGVALTPDQAASHAILGSALAAVGQEAEAEESFKTAIELDVNYAAAFSGLLQLNHETEAKKTGLAFIRREMQRQVLDGNGLHAYRAHAYSILAPRELLGELREAWQARPDLWESWSVLIAQLLDTGDKAESLKLAEEAAERFALTPGAWRDLAIARRLSGQLEAAIESARRAVQLNLEWPEGWRLLAEYCDDVGRREEAMESLRLAVKRLPFDMALRYNLAQLLWRDDARTEAWNLAEKTAAEDPGQSWAWDCLQGWSVALNRQDELIHFARALTDRRPQEARSWHILARLLPLESIAETKEALDRAISLNPQLIDAYDYRAELLARLGRIDEAEASLANGPWTEEKMHFSLKGRRAWLHAVRGDLKWAMSRMREVLEVHRDYYWGWETYAEWASQVANVGECKRAAAEMIRLAPRSPAPYSVAADAELQANNREKGIEYLKQALHLDPGNPYAAMRLLEQYWIKRETRLITTTAGELPTSGIIGIIRSAYLMLAAAHENRADEMRAELMFLATHPDLMGQVLQIVSDYFQATKSKNKFVLYEVLEQAVAEDTIGPAFSILWVQRELQRQNWDCWKQLAKWMPRLGAKLDASLRIYLDGLGDAKKADPYLLHFIREHGTQLRQRGEIWGKVSYALANSGAFPDCVAWLMPDYQRADAQGWTLFNLSYSLRMSGKPEQAAVVSQYAVEQGLRDSQWQQHVAIAALGFAETSRYEEAAALLKRDSLEGVPAEWKLMGVTAQALCDVMSRPPAEGKKFFKQFLRKAKSTLGSEVLSAPGHRQYQDALALMKRHTGASVMPWQKISASSPGGLGPAGTKTAIIIGIILLLNVVRFCEKQMPAPAPPPQTSPLPLLLKPRQEPPPVPEAPPAKQPESLPLPDFMADPFQRNLRQGTTDGKP